MADEHTFTLTFEASGEVTPAEKATPAEPAEPAEADTNDGDTTNPEPEETEQ